LHSDSGLYLVLTRCLTTRWLSACSPHSPVLYCRGRLSMVSFSFLETLGLINARARAHAALLVGSFLLYTFVVGILRMPRLRLIDLFMEYVAARVLAAHGKIYSFRQLRAMADHIGGVPYGSAVSNLLSAYTHPPS